MILTDTYLFIFLTGPIGYPIPISQVGHEAALAAYEYAKTRQQSVDEEENTANSEALPAST